MPNARNLASEKSEAPDSNGGTVLRPLPDVELCSRGEVRVEKFLEAATEVFLEKGYHNARLSDIVARAGGSLSTLYRAYGDKEGLAHAIMARSIAVFGKGLQDLRDSDLPPEQALAAAADHMIDEILSPGRIVSHRIVIAEGLDFPELRDWFFKHGVATAEALLTDYFQKQKQAGQLVLDSPAVAADRFYMMVFGGVIARTVNGMITPADKPRVKAEAREAVRIFLHGTLPGRPA